MGCVAVFEFSENPFNCLFCIICTGPGYVLSNSRPCNLSSPRFSLYSLSSGLSSGLSFDTLATVPVTCDMLRHKPAPHRQTAISWAYVALRRKRHQLALRCCLFSVEVRSCTVALSDHWICVRRTALHFQGNLVRCLTERLHSVMVSCRHLKKWLPSTLPFGICRICLISKLRRSRPTWNLLRLTDETSRRFRTKFPIWPTLFV